MAPRRRLNREPAPFARSSQEPSPTLTVQTAAGPLILCAELGGGAPAVDPAAALMAELVQFGPGDAVLDLHCGAGLVGAVAARLVSPGAVTLTDRSSVAVAAAQQTLALNDLTDARVLLSDGLSHLALADSVDIVTARLPKERLSALQLIWDGYRALRPGGRFYIAGANNEGIKSALGHTRELFGELALLGYRKGHRLGVACKGSSPTALPDDFQSDWLDHGRYHVYEIDTRGGRYQVYSRPGVFAWQGLDAGTRALIDVMTIASGDAMLELGCGAGLIGAVAARLAGAAGSVTMVDSDIIAVECARRTLAANGVTTATVHAGDSAAPVHGRVFDLVITNPPFHAGTATAYGTAARFIQDAHAALRPGGALVLVANRHLPYEEPIAAVFGNVTSLSESGGYKVLRATKADKLPQHTRRR